MEFCGLQISTPALVMAMLIEVLIFASGYVSGFVRGENNAWQMLKVDEDES